MPTVTTDDCHETYVLLPLILGSPTLSLTSVSLAVGKVHLLSEHLGSFLSWTWLFLTLYVAARAGWANPGVSPLMPSPLLHCPSASASPDHIYIRNDG